MTVQPDPQQEVDVLVAGVGDCGTSLLVILRKLSEGGDPNNGADAGRDALPEIEPQVRFTHGVGARACADADSGRHLRPRLQDARVGQAHGVEIRDPLVADA